MWTDAFGVCNFLGLYRRTGDGSWRRVGLASGRSGPLTCWGVIAAMTNGSGWISGLSEEEGKRHPAIGGLRIGKKINERKLCGTLRRPGGMGSGRAVLSLFDEMDACPQLREPEHGRSDLQSMGDRTGKKRPCRLCLHPAIRFKTHVLENEHRSNPSPGGLHGTARSAGWVDYLQPAPDNRTGTFPETADPGLVSEIADMEALCSGQNWVTDDPLGIGGLLGDAYRILQRITKGGFARTDLLTDLLESSLSGLDAFTRGHLLRLPADYRLAFRELGMSIGLHAVERMEEWLGSRSRPVPGKSSSPSADETAWAFSPFE